MLIKNNPNYVKVLNLKMKYVNSFNYLVSRKKEKNVLIIILYT